MFILAYLAIHVPQFTQVPLHITLVAQHPTLPSSTLATFVVQAPPQTPCVALYQQLLHYILYLPLYLQPAPMAGRVILHPATPHSTLNNTKPKPSPRVTLQMDTSESRRHVPQYAEAPRRASATGRSRPRAEEREKLASSILSRPITHYPKKHAASKSVRSPQLSSDNEDQQRVQWQRKPSSSSDLLLDAYVDSERAGASGKLGQEKGISRLETGICNTTCSNATL